MIRPYSLLDASHSPKATIKRFSGWLPICTAPLAIYELFQKKATSRAYVCGNVSLITSAAISQDGAKVVSWLALRFFSQDSLTRVFGPNSTFVVNPRHPRHLASFVALFLMVPVLVTEAKRIYKKIPSNSNENVWLKRAVMVSFLFNRVVLHVGNQVVAKGLTLLK